MRPVRLARARDAFLLLTVAAYSAGYADWGLGAVLLVGLSEAFTRSWRWPRTALDRPLLVFLVAALLSAVASEWRTTSLLLALLLAITALVSIRSVAAYTRGETVRTTRLLQVWIGGAVVAALWGAMRALTRGAPATTAGLGENGLGTTLAVAAILALGLLVAWPGRRRWLLAPVLAVMLLGLTLTLARAAWLGAAAGALSLVAVGPPARARRTLALAAAGAVVLGVLLLPRWPPVYDELRSIPSFEANRNRIIIWRTVPRIVADHPLVGTGYGTFVDAYPRYRLPEATELTPPFAHNLLLNFAAETGLLGLAALIALCGASLASTWRWMGESPERSEGRALATSIFAALTALLVNQLGDGSVMSVHVGFGFLTLLILGPVSVWGGRAGRRLDPAC